MSKTSTKPARLPAIRRKGDPDLLVFAFIFPLEEVKFNPWYTRGMSREELKEKFEDRPETPDSSDEEEEECSDEDKEVPMSPYVKALLQEAPLSPVDPYHTRSNPRMLSTLSLLRHTARQLWKNSCSGRVWLPKSDETRVSGGAHAVILATNNNSDEREIPSPEIIEKLKEALNTTRDPRWYRCIDEDFF